jgi:hypothetical protein
MVIFKKSNLKTDAEKEDASGKENEELKKGSKATAGGTDNATLLLTRKICVTPPPLCRLVRPLSQTWNLGSL